MPLSLPPPVKPRSVSAASPGPSLLHQLAKASETDLRHNLSMQRLPSAVGYGASFEGLPNFGFRKLEGVVMPPPTNPERVLGLELRPGAWEGVTGEVTRNA